MKNYEVFLKYISLGILIYLLMKYFPKNNQMEEKNIILIASIIVLALVSLEIALKNDDEEGFAENIENESDDEDTEDLDDANKGLRRGPIPYDDLSTSQCVSKDGKIDPSNKNCLNDELIKNIYDTVSNAEREYKPISDYYDILTDVQKEKLKKRYLKNKDKQKQLRSYEEIRNEIRRQNDELKYKYLLKKPPTNNNTEDYDVDTDDESDEDTDNEEDNELYKKMSKTDKKKKKLLDKMDKEVEKKEKEIRESHEEYMKREKEFQDEMDPFNNEPAKYTVTSETPRSDHLKAHNMELCRKQVMFGEDEHRFKDGMKTSKEQVGTRHEDGVIQDEMKYTDYNVLPVPQKYQWSPNEYGYNFLPPSQWFPTPPNPPVCVTNKQNNVCPIHTEGSNLDLKEWHESRRITPPDGINTDYVKEKLNSGR